MSQSQQLLDQGKYLITVLDGYWHMILPPMSWIQELLGDNMFRTGFDSEVPEDHVREFYAKRLEVRSSEIVLAVK